MTRITRWIAGLLVALLTVGLVMPPLLSGAAVQDAPFTAVGTLLQGLAPIFTTLLVSGLTWVANTGTGLIKDLPNIAKYAVMGVIGVAVSTLFSWMGHTVSSDTSTWTAVVAEGMAAAAVAAVIFKVGRASATPKPL